jgi:polysaccharide export outer membrane protein
VPTVRDYRIGVGDELEITLNTDPPRTQSYVVRPDGRFALPDHGEILAAGQRPADLGRAIAARLADTYVNPSVTVNVRRFTTNSDDFLAMISSPTSARAENITVAPDGTITPPLLQSIRAVGHTTDELTSIVDHDYGQRLGSITTTIRLNSVAAQQVFVFGEVQRPGPIPALRARTVLQLIASAGGPNEFAAMNAVRVLYWDAAGQAHIRQVNVMAVLDTLSLDEDVAVPPNAVVYVPPTQLAKAGRMVNQILQRLFLFQGTSVGLQFGNTNTFLK